MKQLSKKAKGLLLLVLCAALILPCVNGHALTQRQKALNAYAKWLSPAKINVLERGAIYRFWDGKYYRYTNGTVSSQVKFGLAYIDGDSVPELIVVTGQGDSRLYGIITYKNGKLVRIFSSRVNSNQANEIFQGYYYKRSAFKTILYGEGRWCVHKYYQINNKNKVFSNFHHNVRWDGELEGRGWYKDNVLSISAYRAQFRKVSNGQKLAQVKFYSNIAANRKKYLR